MHFKGFPQKHNAFQRLVQHFPQKHNGFELLLHTLVHITKMGKRLASRLPIVSYESRGRIQQFAPWAVCARECALVLHWPGRDLPSLSLLLWCCTAALHAQCQQQAAQEHRRTRHPAQALVQGRPKAAWRPSGFGVLNSTRNLTSHPWEISFSSLRFSWTAAYVWFRVPNEVQIESKFLS